MNTSSKSTKAADQADVEKPGVEAEALDAEIAALRADLRALADQVSAVGAAARSGAKKAARALAADGTEAGAQAAAELLAEWRDFDRRVVGETRANPWRSLGVAALIGLLFGLTWRR